MVNWNNVGGVQNIAILWIPYTWLENIQLLIKCIKCWIRNIVWYNLSETSSAKWRIFQFDSSISFTFSRWNLKNCELLNGSNIEKELLYRKEFYQCNIATKTPPWTKKWIEFHGISKLGQTFVFTLGLSLL